MELTATCEQLPSVMQIALVDYFVRAQCTFPNLECVARKKRNAASFRRLRFHGLGGIHVAFDRIARVSKRIGCEL